MLKKLVYLLSVICFCLIGCEKKINIDDVYKELEGNTYNINRCYKYDDYEYLMSFSLNFLEDKKVNFKFEDLNCVSDKCFDNEDDAYFMIYPVTNSSTETNKFTYKLEYDDNFKVLFEDNDDGTYFNIDDLVFEYESGKIINFNIDNLECIDIQTLITEDETTEDEEVSNSFTETNNVHAKNCAISAIKEKLFKYYSIDVDVSSVMLNEATGEFIVQGTCSYKNEYNAKLNYNFTCQVKDLSNCDTSIIIY